MYRENKQKNKEEHNVQKSNRYTLPEPEPEMLSINDDSQFI